MMVAVRMCVSGVRSHTSATGAERAVSVAALSANSDDFTIDVLGLVGVDVAGAATAVRNFRGSHCGVL